VNQTVPTDLKELSKPALRESAFRSVFLAAQLRSLQVTRSSGAS
jgi:hypothetical protein